MTIIFIYSSFRNYQVGEGKNESDTLGSLAKLAFKRGVHQLRDEASRTVEAIADLIRSNIQESTKKYEFIRIVVVPEIERDPKPQALPHPGIQQRHLFLRNSDGSIFARDLSCTKCIELSRACDDCIKSSKVIYTPAHPLPEEEGEEEGDIEVDEEEENLYDEEVDISFSGGEEYDEDVCDDDDAICWVRIRSWYPAQICPEDEIPDAMRRFLPRDRGSEVVVRKFPPFDQEYCVVKISNIRELCENEFDNERSARSGGAMAAYHIALATKKNRNTHVQWN